MQENHEEREAEAAKETAGHGEEEPWLPIETKLVVRSVISGVVALVVLAVLVHIFLLK